MRLLKLYQIKVLAKNSQKIKNNVSYDNFDGDVDDDKILFPELKKNLKSKHLKTFFLDA